MAPFTYQQYRNPYVGSISDLITRPGDIRAAAAEKIAAAQAAATQQSGQAYAGAAQQVGQAVTGAVLQATDPRRQAEALHLKEQKDAIAAHDTFKSILKDTPQIQENGMNLYDLSSLGDRAVKAGIDPSPYLVEYGKVNEAFRAESSARQATIQTAAQSLAKAPDPDLALNFIDLAQRNRTIDGATAARLKSAIDAAQTPAEKAAIVQKIAITYAGQQTPLKLAGAARPGAAPETAINPLTHEVIATGATAGPAQPTPSSIAMDAAGGDPVKANALLHPEVKKNPPSVQEQLLEAISKGDTATADNITKTLRAEAAARQDPAAAALAGQLRSLSVEQAKARLDEIQKKNAPVDVSPDVQTTGSGRKYIDLSSYSAAERDKARTAAEKTGAIAVSKEQADSLQQIDNARMNQQSIIGQISDILPKDASGRPLAALSVPLEKLFQTNDQISAFGSWRTAAINSMRATAGSKGLRINRAEIEQAIENDIPKLTDTLGTARQKVANVNTMLENAEKSILVRDRSAGASAKPEASAMTRTIRNTKTGETKVQTSTDGGATWK